MSPVLSLPGAAFASRPRAWSRVAKPVALHLGVGRLRGPEGPGTQTAQCGPRRMHANEKHSNPYLRKQMHRENLNSVAKMEIVSIRNVN